MATLSVTLVRARDLVASDNALEGDTSDPFVVFQVGNEVQQSSCIHQQLNPEWRPREVFDFPVIHAQKDLLKVQVYDYDTYSAHDSIGTLVLPVSKFAQTPDIRQHEVYFLEIPQEFHAQQCQSMIELDICFHTDASKGHTTLRMWENQVWSVVSGWVSSDTEIYRRYSSFDDTVTSPRFELAAPKAPEGTDPQGWAYVLDSNRDESGWMYAYNFLGPFAVTKNMSSYVRRRLWENKCVLAQDQ